METMTYFRILRKSALQKRQLEEAGDRSGGQRQSLKKVKPRRMTDFESSRSQKQVSESFLGKWALRGGFLSPF